MFRQNKLTLKELVFPSILILIFIRVKFNNFRQNRYLDKYLNLAESLFSDNKILTSNFQNPLHLDLSRSRDLTKK